MSQNQLMMVDETLTFSVEHEQLYAGAAAKLEGSSHITWELPIENPLSEKQIGRNESSESYESSRLSALPNSPISVPNKGKLPDKITL